MTKIAKINTLFMNKKAENPYPLGPVIIREYLSRDANLPKI